MFRVLCRVLFFSCFILFAANPVSSEVKQGPKAVISNPEFDFKDVKQGETVEHAFTIQNRGDLPLKVLNVRPG